MNRFQVLLAEDNDGDVLLVHEALRTHQLDCGMSVLADGDEAISYLRRIGSDGAVCPDIFLVDLNLPGHDGFELVKAFRKYCGHAVPVVIITSSDAPQDIARARELGANEYFRKPMQLDKFLQLGSVVKSLLPAT